jgi:hypothetical protein
LHLPSPKSRLVDWQGGSVKTISSSGDGLFLSGAVALPKTLSDFPKLSVLFPMVFNKQFAHLPYELKRRCFYLFLNFHSIYPATNGIFG